MDGYHDETQWCVFLPYRRCVLRWRSSAIGDGSDEGISIRKREADYEVERFETTGIMTSVVPLPTTVEMSSEVPKLLWEGFLFVGGVSNPDARCPMPNSENS